MWYLSVFTDDVAVTRRLECIVDQWVASEVGRFICKWNWSHASNQCLWVTAPSFPPKPFALLSTKNLRETSWENTRTCLWSQEQPPSQRARVTPRMWSTMPNQTAKISSCHEIVVPLFAIWKVTRAAQCWELHRGKRTALPCPPSWVVQGLVSSRKGRLPRGEWKARFGSPRAVRGEFDDGFIHDGSKWCGDVFPGWARGG